MASGKDQDKPQILLNTGEEPDPLVKALGD